MLVRRALVRDSGRSCRWSIVFAVGKFPFHSDPDGSAQVMADVAGCLGETEARSGIQRPAR